ncbi:response regulator transcription factor [Streptomyces eurocidicus]|uniref:DNA-binding CsgD family transcriptional regulator n=1 Tax=Streptomyces eurocidicus TaxID=66423 RepID=A0A7W8F2C9_STREU|nr:helix-turn-helix transcriptional regulator [Streptomyces eurocidicus]MBB5118715.1 DNA-binding CsgD family transcriptional regulator [Streptomyces eurocidicus]
MTICRDRTGEGRRILLLIARGRTNREIAETLGVSEWAVKWRLRELCRVLGARDRAHAVAQGIRSGLISVRDMHLQDDR